MVSLIFALSQPTNRKFNEGFRCAILQAKRPLAASNPFLGHPNAKHTQVPKEERHYRPTLVHAKVPFRELRHVATTGMTIRRRRFVENTPW
jgi:hypothetical protein